MNKIVSLLLMVMVLVTLLAIPKSMAEDLVKPSLETDGYNEAEQTLINEKGEKHHFQAEVNKLMNIIINSLYSKKEIFLRELISNAADALDKIRFLSLTNPALLGEGDVANLDIRIKVDKENRFLHIIDKGIGMTKDDLIKNLGTIAQSGTKEFIQKVTESSEGASNNLIGQFGVGFYSLFLASDYVIVTSKNNEDDQYIWTSTSDSSFSIIKDPKGNTLGRGTRISLHIKDDSLEFLDENLIEELVKRYSQFINFPIYLYKSSEIEEPIEPTEEEPVETTKEQDEEVQVGEEEEGDEEEEETEAAPKTKKVTVYEWEQLNNNKPLWMRSPKEVTKEEYEQFYQALNKRTDKPFAYSHFVAEGDTEFRSILYIPEEAPQNLFDPEAILNGIKLFVRRVFITDNIRDLLPSWLRFLQGIIDSDDLPLNVSREILQQHKILEVIKKKIVKKFIQMVQEISNREDQTDYHNFFKKYGTSLKFGVIEEAKDTSNKNRLIKLLQFHSSKDEHTTFENYVSRMKEGQDQIYYLAGKSKEQLAISPLVEQALKRGYEVLYLVDPIDEYCFQQINKYNDFTLTNLAREGVKFDKETEEDKESEKTISEEFKPLTEYLQKTLGKRVQRVTISKILSDSPCALVSNQWGVTANMERIMKAQSVSGQQEMAPYMTAKIMEINPSHPLIRQLLARLNEFGKEDEVAKVSANVLYETAALSSGYTIDNPTTFSHWIYKIMEISGEKLSQATYNVKQEEQEEEEQAPPMEEPEFNFENTAESIHDHHHDEL